MTFDPGQPAEQLQGGQGGVEVGFPRGDEAVAHQISGADEHGVTGVCMGRRNHFCRVISEFAIFRIQHREVTTNQATREKQSPTTLRTS